MKPEELSIYIGEIDDDLITGAKKKRSIHKKVIMIAGSVAACAVLAVTGVFLMTHQKPTTEVSVPGTGGYTEQGDRPASGNATGGEISEGLLIESSGDGTIEIIDSKIYYVEDGKLLSKTETHEARPEVVFDLWKKMNHIGDEIGFVSVNIDSNGWTEESEVDGQGVGIYHVGDHFVYRMRISMPLDAYFAKTDKELLLESLEKTMLDGTDMKFDEFDLSWNDLALEDSNGSDRQNDIMRITGNSDAPKTDASAGSGAETDGPKEPDTESIVDSNIYYVEDGQLLSKTVTYEADPEVVFDLWKKMNHIGDDVRLVYVNIDDDGRTEDSAPQGDGMTAGIRHAGDHFVYRMMISQPLDAYFTKTDKELLLESLEKTMLDGTSISSDEFELSWWE